MHVISHILGLDNPNGAFQLFWGGFGSDLSEITLLAAVFGLWRRHNCAVTPCWRLGRHEVVLDGTKHIVCRRHHPDGHLRASDLTSQSER